MFRRILNAYAMGNQFDAQEVVNSSMGGLPVHYRLITNSHLVISIMKNTSPIRTRSSMHHGAYGGRVL